MCPGLLWRTSPSDTIQAAAVSPDNRWLVTAAEDKTMRLWNLGVDDPSTDVRTLREHKSPVEMLAFSADGRWMMSASIDDAPRIKRFNQKDRGRAHQILKRLTHITVSVQERA